MFAQKEEQDFFLSHLNKSFDVLEYGSGSSTIDIAPLVKKLISIEHSESWYTNIKKQILENTTIILKKPDIEYIEGGHDGTYEQFYSYINAPKEYGKFDVIFIDGRARVECVKFIKNVAKENTIVFVHDFYSRQESDNYKEMLKYLKIVDGVADICKLRLI